MNLSGSCHALLLLRLSCVATATVVLTGGIALAADANESRDVSPKAIDLYEKATAAFDKGDYPQAAAMLTEAIALDSNPLLIFNLAQAERLAGHCEAALAQYDSFLKAQTGSEHVQLRDQAVQHITRLRISCAPAPVPVVKAQEPASLPLAVTNHSQTSPVAVTRAEKRSTRPWWLVPGVALGATTLASAGGLMLWNNAKHDQWTNTDRYLQEQRAAGLANQELLDEQRRNDRLLNSIQDVNVLAISLAVAGAVISLAVTGSWLVVGKAPTVQATPSDD